MDLRSKMAWLWWRSVVIDVDCQGSLLKVKIVSGRHGTQPPKQSGTRGIVTHFSKDARKRMIDLMARLDRKKIAWGRHKPKFITLTYDRNMIDHKKAARDLKVFVERMQERYPRCSIIWRKEQQKRGAIHFHLMVFGVPFMEIHTSMDTGWQDHWNQVSGNSIKNRNSFDIEVIKSMNGVMFYVSKYMAKEDTQPPKETEYTSEKIPYGQIDQSANVNTPFLGLSMPHIFSATSTGRWWGCYGRKNLPLATRVKRTHIIPQATFSMWLAMHVESGYASTEHSFTVYRNDALKRYDGLLRIMAMHMILHEETEYQYRKRLRRQISIESRSDYMPDFLYGIVTRIDDKKKNIIRAVERHHGMNPKLGYTTI